MSVRAHRIHAADERRADPHRKDPMAITLRAHTLLAFLAGIALTLAGAFVLQP